MSSREVIAPALRVLGHAELKGAEYGSTAGLLLALPAAAVAGNSPSAGGMACYAGGGLVVGATLSTVLATVKLATSDKAGIMDRADRLKKNEEQKIIDRISGAGSVAGFSYAICRFVSESQKKEEPLPGIVFTSRGAWLSLAYAAVGMGVSFGAYSAVKAVHAAIEKTKKKGADSATAAVDDAQNAVEEKTEKLESTAEEGAEAAKDAVSQAVDSASSTAASATGGEK